jgi:hypothetical protein
MSGLSGISQDATQDPTGVDCAHTVRYSRKPRRIRLRDGIALGEIA